jgi:hypothetical protein
MGNWLIGREGFVLRDLSLLDRIAPQLIIVVAGGRGDYQPWGEIRSLLPGNALIASYIPGVFDDFNNRIKGVFQSAIHGLLYPFTFERRPVSHTTFAPLKLLEKVEKLRPGRDVQVDLAAVRGAKKHGSWREIGSGLALPQLLIDAITSISVEESHLVMFSALKFDNWVKSDFTDAAIARWMEILDTPMIPFDVRKRSALERRAAHKIGDLLEVRRQALVKRQGRRVD